MRIEVNEGTPSGAPTPVKGDRACPTCGILRRYLEGAHSTALPHLDTCPDDFHGSGATRRRRKARAESREGEEQAQSMASDS